MDIINLLSRLIDSKADVSISDSGHLVVKSEVTVLPDELLSELYRHEHEIISFLKQDDHVENSDVSTNRLPDSFLASNAQQRIYFASSISNSYFNYTINKKLRIQGKLDLEVFEFAVNCVIDANESLRSHFHVRDGELYQTVSSKYLPPYFHVITHDTNESDLSRVMRFKQFDDLINENLFYLCIECISPELHYLYISSHHLITDGNSLRIVLVEILNCYVLLAQKVAIQNINKKKRISDYNSWTLQLYDRHRATGAKLFWAELFRSSYEFPVKQQSYSKSSSVYTFKSTELKISFQSSQSIVKFCRETEITPFIFFVTSIGVTLSRLLDVQDIVLGLPVSNQVISGFVNEVGLFQELIPMFVRINGEKTFSDLVGECQVMFADALRHLLPLDEILSLNPLLRDRFQGHGHLFTAIVAAQTTLSEKGQIKESFGGLHVWDASFPDQAFKVDRQVPPSRICDLAFNLYPGDGTEFGLRVDYLVQTYSDEFISSFFECLSYLIENIFPSKGIRLRDTNLFSNVTESSVSFEHLDDNPLSDRSQFLSRILSPNLDISTSCIYFRSNQLRFSDLRLISEKFSTLLSAHMEPGGRVVVFIERSEFIIPIMLAIWNSGGVYVPIDHTYPEKRVNDILEDVGPSLLIVSKGLLSNLPAHSIISQIEYDLFLLLGHLEVTSHDLAYILYTSGSTGVPKGVMITFPNVCNFISWALEEYCETKFDVMFCATSFSFDISIFELIVPILLNRNIFLFDNYAELVERSFHFQNIFINTVPSILRTLLLKEIDWTRISALNVSGESCPPSSLPAKLFRDIEIRNLYGPTETTIFSSSYRVSDIQDCFLPIGSPISSTSMVVLDQFNRVKPNYVVGQLAISGRGVGVGYTDESMNVGKFICKDSLSGDILFLTGDFVYRTENNVFYFVGRRDSLAKVNGCRVDLREIEVVLQRLDGVQDVSAFVKSDSAQLEQIVAVLRVDRDIHEDEIRAHLGSYLPVWMIPRLFSFVDKIPLFVNGKRNIQQLIQGTDFSIDNCAEIPDSQDLDPIFDECLHCLGGEQQLDVARSYYQNGGGSLSLIRFKWRLKQRFGIDFSLSELSEFPSILMLARYVRDRTSVKLASTVSGAHPLQPDCWQEALPQQAALFYLSQNRAASRAYNMHLFFTVHGVLDVDVLRCCFVAILSKHPSLRTAFRAENGTVYSRYSPLGAKLDPLDLIFRDDSSNLDDHLKLVREEWQEFTFDLEKEPLYRFCLYKYPADSILCIVVHHSICDAQSLNIALVDLVHLYRSSSVKKPVPGIQATPIDFDYTHWLRSYKLSDQYSSSVAFWMSYLAGIQPSPFLSADSSLSDSFSYIGKFHYDSFENSLTSEIAAFCRSASCSSFALLFASFSILMRSYFGKDEFLIGIPTSGRIVSEADEVTGFFTNLLPYVVRISPSLEFIEYLRSVGESIVKILENQMINLESLSSGLSNIDDGDRYPLFSSVFVLNSYEGSPDMTLIDNLVIKRKRGQSKYIKYPLLFSISQYEKEQSIEIEFDPTVFTEDVIAQLTIQFKNILQHVISHTNAYIRDIPTLSPKQLEVLEPLSQVMSLPVQKNLLEYWDDILSKCDGDVALRYLDHSVNYRSLDMMSNIIADFCVRNDLSSGRVGLYLNPSHLIPICILGVVKAGCTYVPLDPDLPRERLDYIIQDCGISLVFTDNNDLHLFDAHDCTVVNVHEFDFFKRVEFNSIEPAEICYVIYTSGTTGVPKGVQVYERSISNLLFCQEFPYDFKIGDRWSLSHSFSFDVSVWEIFCCLLYGGTLYIPDRMTVRDANAFSRFIIDSRITVLNQTPSSFNALSYSLRDTSLIDILSDLKYLIFAGEPLDSRQLVRWISELRHMNVYNMYGITETTIHSTFKKVELTHCANLGSNIGIPLPCVSCYVLNLNKTRTPPGFIGELHIGGAGVSKGYLGSQELTAKRFITNPFSPGTLYQSGDFVKVTDCGELEFISRRDDQVKVHGFRIELTEIAAAFTTLTPAYDAVAYTFTGPLGGRELAVIVVCQPSDFDPYQFRYAVRGHLPAYMVPSVIIRLDEMPLTVNGKLDRRRLPSPANYQVVPPGESPLMTEIQREVLLSWNSILGTAGSSLDANFFDLGGHSISGSRLIADINKKYPVQLTLHHLFRFPTIASLCELIILMSTSDSLN